MTSHAKHRLIDLTRTVSFITVAERNMLPSAGVHAHIISFPPIHLRLQKLGQTAAGYADDGARWNE